MEWHTLLANCASIVAKTNAQWPITLKHHPSRRSVPGAALCSAAAERRQRISEEADSPVRQEVYVGGNTARCPSLYASVAIERQRGRRRRAEDKKWEAAGSLVRQWQQEAHLSMRRSM